MKLGFITNGCQRIFSSTWYQFAAKVKDNSIILSVFSRSLSYNGRMITKIGRAPEGRLSAKRPHYQGLYLH